MTSTNSGLEGKSILVTGGGTGIGKACAARLIADGANVTISGRRAEVLEQAVVDILATAGGSGSLSWTAGDVTREEDVQTMVSHASDDRGRLHGCVANAGGGGIPAAYADQDTEEFKRVLDLNVMGTFYSIKHCLPAMLKAGTGSFVGMSSLAGHVTHPYFGAYCVGKAGLEEMMRNAADEYGAQNIRFNAIRPGFVSTEIMEGIPRESDVYDSYIRNTPMNGVAEPEDIANLARFLLSNEARWITGQIINVDGGHSLRRGPDFGSFVG